MKEFAGLFKRKLLAVKDDGVGPKIWIGIAAIVYELLKLTIGNLGLIHVELVDFDSHTLVKVAIKSHAL